MNIFVLHPEPGRAARMMCDKHIPKMVVETMQMLGSVVIRHGAHPEDMPLTSQGTPLKGGYHKHPCTVWAGETRANYNWLCRHGFGLLNEYRLRFDKIHACREAIEWLSHMAHFIPQEGGTMTPFAQAMPEQYKGDRAHYAYRAYYASEKAHFAKWERGTPAPDWWEPYLEAVEMGMFGDGEKMPGIFK